jgi:hypothetical protein
LIDDKSDCKDNLEVFCSGAFITADVDINDEGIVNDAEEEEEDEEDEAKAKAKAYVLSPSITFLILSFCSTDDC